MSDENSPFVTGRALTVPATCQASQLTVASEKSLADLPIEDADLPIEGDNSLAQQQRT